MNRRLEGLLVSEGFQEDQVEDAGVQRRVSSFGAIVLFV